MAAKLYIEEPEGSREISLEQSPISIGRVSSCAIQINEKKASKEHCILEREGNTWRLVDNMSSNGTLVNGQQINTKLLDKGDLIIIGSTKIRFESGNSELALSPSKKKKEKQKDSDAPPEKEKRKKTASTPPSEEVSVSEKTPKKKKTERELPAQNTPKKQQTEAKAPIVPDEKNKNARKKAPVSARSSEKKQVEQIKKFSLIGVCVLVLLLIANNLYQDSLRQGQANSLENQAFKLSKTARDHSDYLKNLEQSISLYQELLDGYANTPAGSKAEGQLKKITAVLETEKGAEKEFRNAQDRTRSAVLEISFLEQKNLYEKILQKYPDSRIALKIQREINGLQEEIFQQTQKEFQETKNLVEACLANEEYGAAFSALDELIRKYENEAFLKNMATELAESRNNVEKRAKNSLERTLEKIDGALQTQNNTFAQRLIEEALHNFRGTVYHSEIKVRQTMLGMVATKKMDVATAQAEAKKREKLYNMMEKSESLLKSRRYREAYEELKKLSTHSELNELADEKTKLLAQVEDLSKVVGLLDKLVHEINSSGLETRSILKGQKVRLFEANEKAIGVELEGGQARSQKRWSDMSSDDYYKLFNELKLESPERLALATFCFESQMEKEAHQQMILAVEKNANLKDYADLLYGRKSNQAVPDGGFVIYESRFMRPEEKDRAVVTKDAKKLIATLSGGTEASRAEKMKALTQLLSDAGSRHGEEFIQKLKSNIVSELREQRMKMLKELASSNAFKDVSVLQNLKKELNKRRAAALALIRDEERYPYPYFPSEIKQKEVQDEVDKLVAAVEEIWKRPFDNVAQVNPTIGLVTNRIKEIEEQIKTFEPTFNPEDEDGLNLNYIASLAGESLSIRNFGLDKKEQDLIAYNKEVMSYNERVETIAGGIEKKQIQITNEYRNMFGEHAVRICDELVQAARWHSEYMASSGIFAHVIDGHPHGRGPSERCIKAGYGGGVSENCHMGVGDPLGAHIGWCHSSGHHRNILAPHWRVLGAGLSGSYWTQNFGSDLGSTREKANKLGNTRLPAGDKGGEGGDKKDPNAENEKDEDSKKGNTGRSGGSTGTKSGKTSGTGSSGNPGGATGNTGGGSKTGGSKGGNSGGSGRSGGTTSRPTKIEEEPLQEEEQEN